MWERGEIKTVSDRGFCFIKPADGYGTDLFAHISAFGGSMPFDGNLVGQTVEFQAGINPKNGKHCAVSVRPVTE